MSSVACMNDSLELNWGFEILDRASKKFRKEFTSREAETFVNELNISVIALAKQVRFIAACFSREGDLLSQWRAYTNDGIGFAIGFDADEFEKNEDLVIKKINYNEPNQIEDAYDGIVVLYKAFKIRESKTDDVYFAALSSFLMCFPAYKNPAFREEKEIRFLSSVDNQNDPKNGKLSHSVMYPKYPVGFTMKSGRPTPYVDLPFRVDGGSCAIGEVLIGPKNPSTEIEISEYLATLGLDGVVVRRSAASYR